ncbi:uncharacterized protein CIMG_08914 [Coccidioides immitis RS]|uniref:Uncharacterized protein n=1 Tax=Coccidioides immitis (strain RS) TaxID=246410 RepID=A0A0E1S1I0_COCIM|nr:uncharacterized protein CIMG_08914 [Coccidioides immitis RS]EAS30168.2 hypothetical protein CIMG_08914 [Coccidioides immitis RS]
MEVGWFVSVDERPAGEEYRAQNHSGSLKLGSHNTHTLRDPDNSERDRQANQPQERPGRGGNRAEPSLAFARESISHADRCLSLSAGGRDKHVRWCWGFGGVQERLRPQDGSEASPGHSCGLETHDVARQSPRQHHPARDCIRCPLLVVVVRSLRLARNVSAPLSWVLYRRSLPSLTESSGGTSNNPTP